jgi:hypothetical protein
MEITEINGDFSVLDKTKSLARTDRNKRLSETDWWGASDLIMTDAQTAYRQALRDVPSQEGFPDNISWPTKPM